VEENKSSGRIIEKKDLGNGRKQVTFSVDSASVDETIEELYGKGIVKDVGGYNIGKGSVKSRYMPNQRNPYTSNDSPYTQALETPDDPHKKIALAVELYHKEPIVGTVVDMMVDFSSSGFENECDDENVKKLYDAWCKDINMNNLIEGVFLEFYRSGNVTVYRSDKNAKVTTNKVDKLTKTKTEKNSYNFPAGYTILNPMNVYVEGSLMFNQEVLELSLNQDTVDMVKGKGKGDSKLIEKLVPQEMIKAIRGDTARITLDPKLATRITRKKQPYERYASPFLERVFEPIIYKQKLRQMDMSTIEGLVNQLITVTVGNDDYPASDDDLIAIAELFQTPNKAYTIFWNHTLEVNFHKPEGIDTLAQDKYKQVNEDIMAGLGVSRALLDGQGANLSSAWVSILSLIERLDNAREKVSDWLESEYKRIAEENELPTYPKARFNKMNLREDNYIRDVLLAMYDRGLIDEEDILVETGRDYNRIIEIKKKNEKNAELFLPPAQPFQGGQSGPNDGKPNGPNKNGYKKRDTSPNEQGEAPKPKKTSTASYFHLEEEYETELVEYYNSIQEELYNIVEQEEDGNLAESIIVATIIGMFMAMKQIGNRYIDSMYDHELYNHTTNVNLATISRNKVELKQWNNSYIDKLSVDVREKVKDSIANGSDLKSALDSSFSTNFYRIGLIAESGALESNRQAQIKANLFNGKGNATWATTMDDKACATCRGLHGQTFEIDKVPPRPHSGCRCGLIFN